MSARSWVVVLAFGDAPKEQGISFPQKTQVGPDHATFAMSFASSFETIMLIPNFHLTRISVMLSSLLKIIEQRTGMPVPEMKGSMEICRSEVAPIDAAVSPEFLAQ
jgi:hypothetical protein